VSTRFTKLVGCRLPLQLAAMGGVGTTELASAVADAGGLGMVPFGTEPADGACGVNFLMPFNPSLEEIAETSRAAGVIEFFYVQPRADVVEAAHAAGALAGWQVGSVEEARAAAAAGCDYVVAQGIEAGGHVRGRRRLDDLLPQVLEAVSVPVVAAGGVASAERFASLIRSGADAIRVGTRFVTCPESGAHPDYVLALLKAKPSDTELTEWFGEGWEHAPHRVLRSALEAGGASGWRSTMPPTRGVDTGGVTHMAMYAGMGVGEFTQSMPARDVVAELVSLL
jgi:NAD(P)H-dependent flavin oxidoreductase YrpB (nitropropane dioxygenase family)